MVNKKSKGQQRLDDSISSLTSTLRENGYTQEELDEVTFIFHNAKKEVAKIKQSLVGTNILEGDKGKDPCELVKKAGIKIKARYEKMWKDAEKTVQAIEKKKAKTGARRNLNLNFKF